MYDYDYASTISSLENLENSNEFWTAIGAFFGAYLVVFLVVAVLQIIAMWKIFTKAGEKGWKAIIPIYNTIILFKISGISPWWILLYLTAFIPFVGPVAILVLTICQANGLAKSFGKDIGYTVGLLLLAPIFYMILGFGNSEYSGKPVETTAVEENNNSAE